MRLANKVAVVTGGGLGIGRATAIRFASEGAKVVVVARREEHLKETVRQIQEAGGEASYLSYDCSKEDQIQQMFAEVKQKYGGIDVLFNCAAVYTGMKQKIEHVTLDQWNEALTINMTGYFLCCKHVIPYFRERNGGVIVNCSSISAFIGQPDFGPYSVTKGGVELLSKCMAIDYGKENIRVNTVCPAYVLTEQSAGDHEKIGADKMRELHPVGRAGKPEDVANAVLYLASDESSWVTGSSLMVDGGYTAQ
jgi:NAD(P)-dependent dehydrogenase (short-subunit alcohol dehydrogenase family)